MKKKVAALVVAGLAVCMAAFMLVGCGGSSTQSNTASSDTASTESADDSANIDKLVVGFDSEYPPYGYVDKDGSYTGFDLDLAKRVCEINGWEFQAEAIDWDSKDAQLGSGVINCIWNGFTMEGREGDYTFSEPYMKNGQVIVVKADSDINSLADLAGKTVITQADSAALEVLEGDKKDVADTFKELQTIKDYNNAFMQLESGAVDAVACDLSIAAYQMSAKSGTFKQLDEALSEENYAVGFKLGSQALADKVTEALKQMDADGEVEALCEKYADQGISYTNWVLK